MTAYWINTFTAIRDDDAVARYAELATPAIRDAGGTFLARGLPAQVFEDAPMMRTTLISFDSVDAAVAAYGSPGYQQALAALGDAADREIRIIDGLG